MSNSKMTISDVRAFLNSMVDDDASWTRGYEVHLQKVKKPTPKHLWMLTQIYGAGKKNGAQDMCEFAAHGLLLEGYVLHTIGNSQWGLQRVSAPLAK
jgi:hypothetical protein